MNDSMPQEPFGPQSLAEYLHEHYHPLMYTYALGLCRRYRRPFPLADDLVQCVYVKALFQTSTVDEGFRKKGVSYLFKIIYHELLTINRKETSAKRLEEVFAQNIPKAVNMHYLCLDIHQEAVWELVFAHLSEQDFLIIQLYASGYKYREIAEELSMKENTIASRIRRARLQLEPLFDRQRQQKTKPDSPPQLFDNDN